MNEHRNSPGRNRRQDPRFPVELPVTILNSRPYVTLYTTDVSFRGMFVRTTEPLSVRQLVRFSTILPDTQRVVVLHGMVVNVVEPDNPEGLAEGMGIELYAIDAATREAWWDMVRFIRDGRRVARSASRPRRPGRHVHAMS